MSEKKWRFRFSLLGLFALTTYVAIGLIAMRDELLMVLVVVFPLSLATTIVTSLTLAAIVRDARAAKKSRSLEPLHAWRHWPTLLLLVYVTILSWLSYTVAMSPELSRNRIIAIWLFGAGTLAGITWSICIVRKSSFWERRADEEQA
jgi:hypothetical protein